MSFLACKKTKIGKTTYYRLKKMNIQYGGNKSNVFIYDEQDNDIEEAAKEQIRRLKESTK
jgi:hypothetical protein